ncbi:nitronate monooxygenase [bacterium BMS3Bbin10]|nr:nitronate monooxygenase [bacterium BMS3Bbin10]
MGSIAAAMLDGEGWRGAVAQARRATNGPLNINFFVHPPPGEDPARAAAAAKWLAPYYEELGLGDVPDMRPAHLPFDEAMADVALELGPKVVSFHFGLPEKALVARLRDAGILVLSSATTVREAQILEDGGADIIVAQGFEAGGHRGTFASSYEQAQVGTMALVPQVVDAVSAPVVASGGIGDGRGIAAAFALGAAGVQLGTVFLNCAEAGIAPVYRKALLEARDEDTRVTDAFSGRPARGLANRYIEEMKPHEGSLPEFPLMNILTGPLRKESAARASRDFVSLWSGQAVGLNRETDAGALMENLVARARQLLGS